MRVRVWWCRWCEVDRRRVHNGVGFEPDVSGDHGWLMLEVEDGYAVIDPTVAAFILDGGMPAEMVWELTA